MLDYSVIVSKKSSGNKLKVLAPSGKWASPYRVEGRALVKRVSERHIFKARQAVGVDESVWKAHRDRVDIVRFDFPDGSVREIEAEEFERKSFLHGDGITFAVTRFVPISALTVVQERPPARGQLPLFAGVGV
jgi:hypothetical protein